MYRIKSYFNKFLSFTTLMLLKENLEEVAYKGRAITYEYPDTKGDVLLNEVKNEKELFEVIKIVVNCKSFVKIEIEKINNRKED